jgi:hypothetical protein
LAALTLVAKGTATIRPEINRSASIVPELSFVKYAFVGVFILFSGRLLPIPYIKEVDNSSIFAVQIPTKLGGGFWVRKSPDWKAFGEEERASGG